ncbi:MAG TPA: endo-1,4-beta-xylanase [Stellaceae bacterium]|nr:endo-1,4-beta-xylanase [Stellaceae bacterium]
MKLDRRHLLKAGLAASLVAPACASRADDAPPPQMPVTIDPAFPTDGPPLRVLAKAKGLRFGAAAVWTKALQIDAGLREVYEKETDVIVPDIEFKWGWLRPDATTFSWWGADKLLMFCENADIAFHGHNLAWEEWNPTWLKSQITKANAEQLLRQHIRAVMERYGDHMVSCDVVNEPIWLGHGQPGGLRNGIWLETLGEAYIDIAFDEAHQAAPNTLLILNEAGIETTSRDDQQSREALLKLLGRLRQRGVPVQSIGLESHLSTTSAIDDGDLSGFLNDLAAMGLTIQISELDVSDMKESSSIADRDRKVADVYYRYLTIALRNPQVRSVKTWELRDGRGKPGDDVATLPRPLPFDINLNRKPAWGAIARALGEAPGRA